MTYCLELLVQLSKAFPLAKDTHYLADGVETTVEFDGTEYAITIKPKKEN